MNWVAVAIGGALGACFRYALALICAHSGFRFPLATFIANGLGCFLMGVGFVLLTEKYAVNEVWRHFFLIGLLGAFTTYSTFSIDVLSLLQSELYKLASFYILATLILSIFAAYVGIWISKTFL